MSTGPDFIIIGAMKCATSTLHDQLNRHFGIFMTDPKEPNFFSNDEQYQRGIEWYRSLFRAGTSGDLCGESSTHYTKLPTYPETVERMKDALPDVKLIYVMRHPIRRLISHYVHAWTEREISVPIDSAVDRYPELIDYSRYAMQLRPYLASFGPDRVLPVFFERLTADPQPQLERISRFIGYNKIAVWEHNTAPQNVSAQRLRKSTVRDRLVWNPVSTWVRRRMIPQSWRDRFKRLWQMNKQVELTTDQTERLEAIFDQDLSVLGGWLGVDLNCRDFGSVALDTDPGWREPLAGVGS